MKVVSFILERHRNLCATAPVYPLSSADCAASAICWELSAGVENRHHRDGATGRWVDSPSCCICHRRSRFDHGPSRTARAQTYALTGSSQRLSLIVACTLSQTHKTRTPSRITLEITCMRAKVTTSSVKTRGGLAAAFLAWCGAAVVTSRAARSSRQARSSLFCR